MAAKREVQAQVRAREVAPYLRGQYVRMIIPNTEEGGYLAEVLELPGCVTDGDTPEEAYRNLDEAMAGWIKASLDTNRPIPDPVGNREYSGHFPLRMSTELHRAAALRAMQEGVSLNHWIARAVTEKVAKEDLAEALADKIAPKVAERISVEVSAGFTVRAGEVKTEATDSARLMRPRLDAAFEDTTASTDELLWGYLAGMLREPARAHTLLQPDVAARSRDIVGHHPSRLKGVNRNA